jgi:HlyD family secretion protein
VVESLYFEAGEIVAPGTVVLRLVDLSDVRATFYLPNAELGEAWPDRPATVVADAWPDEEFDAQVITVGAEAEFTPRNIQTRSDRDRLVYAIEVRVQNREGLLRPGMPVQVTLREAERPAATAAPAPAGGGAE